MNRQLLMGALNGTKYVSRARVFPKNDVFFGLYHKGVSKKWNYAFPSDLWTLEVWTAVFFRRLAFFFHINFFKSNIVQIWKHTLCTMLIFKSEHLEHGFVDFAPSICVPKYRKSLLLWEKVQTDRRTSDGHDSHIFILDPVCISRTQ